MPPPGVSARSRQYDPCTVDAGAAHRSEIRTGCAAVGQWHSFADGRDGRRCLLGVRENPFGSNHARGWLLHFNGNLSQSKTPGAFGWDTTASLVPANLVPSYQGASAYLLMVEIQPLPRPRRRWAEQDCDSRSQCHSDRPRYASHSDEGSADEGRAHTGIRGWRQEWCINTAAVDPFTKSVLANNEDGKLYRWDLTTNTLSQTVVLTAGLGEAYTSTVIGPDGKVYATNNATLFAVGQ